VWVAPWIDHVRQDLRYAARRLRRAPAFALTATAILTAGIALNLAFFQLLNVVALRPLPVADLATLVRFDRVAKRFSSNGIPFPATQFIRDHNDVLSAVLTSHAGDVVWGDDPTDRLTVEPQFFPLLHIPILSGRNFEPQDAPGSVAIISRRLAVEMYGTLNAVGKGFPRSKPDRTIVGIAADAPLVHVSATTVAELYSPVGSRDYGRVVLLASARGDPQRLLIPMRDAARAADSRVLPKTSLPTAQFEQRVHGRRAASLAVSLAGVLALSLACFGIFGLVASASTMRTREIGIRRALGAGSGPVVLLLVRQLVVPVSLGMAVGAIAGMAVGRVLEGEPLYLPATDVVIPLAALAVFALTAAFAAIVPALRALRVEPLLALRNE